MNLIPKKTYYTIIAVTLLIALFATTTVLAADIWQNVGSAGFSAGQADYTSMALDSSGTPYVAFQDDTNSDKATVKFQKGFAYE